MRQALRTVAGDDQDVRVQRGKLRFGDGGFAGDAVEGLGLVLVVDEVYLRVQVEEVEVGALDSLLLLLLRLEEVALDELVVVVGLDGRADRAPLLLVPPQLLLDLHLDLLEDLELPLVRGRLLAPFAADVDVVAHRLVGDCARVAHESPAVGHVSRACGYHLRQLVFHLFVGELRTLDAVLLLQQTAHPH